MRVTDNNNDDGDGGHSFSGSNEKIAKQAGALALALGSAAAEAIDDRVGVVNLGERLMAVGCGVIAGYLTKDGMSVDDAQRVVLTAMKSVSEAVVSANGSIKKLIGDDEADDDEEDED